MDTNGTIIDGVAADNISLEDKIKRTDKDILNANKGLAQLWIYQGNNLIALQEEKQCSQNELAKLVGYSKGATSNYIRLARDTRLSSLLSEDNTVHHGERLLDGYNQKKLIAITKLSDQEFAEFVESGVMKSAARENTSDLEDVIEVELENSLEDQITEKELQIEQLQEELKVLKKESEHYVTRKDRAVEKLDENGEIIEYFESIAAATEATMIDKKFITKACLGQLNTAGGFHWRWAEV